MRVAIIGCGTMGSIHAENFSRLPGVKVDAFYCKEEEFSKRLAQRYDAHLCRKEEEVWERKVETVVVCTPSSSHAEWSIRALENGKNVFVEKPLARTLEEAQQIADAAARAKGILMVGHVVRFFHEYVHAKRLLDEGTIGRIGVARLARRARFPLGAENWYSDIDKSGGVILDMMVHDLDFLRWCFGEVREVYARNLMYRNVRQADFGLAVLRFMSGVIAHVEASWMYDGAFHTTFEFAGSKGLISYSSLDASPLAAVLKETSARRENVAVPRSPLNESPYYLEVKHFVDCINRRESLAITTSDALEALRLALAALRSAQTGEPVQLWQTAHKEPTGATI